MCICPTGLYKVYSKKKQLSLLMSTEETVFPVFDSPYKGGVLLFIGRGIYIITRHKCQIPDGGKIIFLEFLLPFLWGGGSKTRFL